MLFPRPLIAFLLLFLPPQLHAGEVTAVLDGESWTVTFSNNTGKTIRLLKPLDGSIHGRIYPHYTFTLTDAQGQVLPLPPRCGLFGFPYSGTKWPEDYLIVIEPGKSQAVPVSPSQRHEAKGTYTVSLTYIFPENVPPTPAGKYPSDLWHGEIKAAPITVTLK